MIYDQSDPSDSEWEGFPEFEEMRSGASREGVFLHASADMEEFGEDFGVSQPSSYDRHLIDSVWEFAEVVPGNDSELWRKDEFGQWICRADFGKRYSEFGWEIFDPGVGRHAQGVYAMRPMQWRSFIRQFDTFG